MIINTIPQQTYAITPSSLPLTVTAITDGGARISLLKAHTPGQYAVIAPTTRMELSREDALATPANGIVIAAGNPGSQPSAPMMSGDRIEYDDNGMITASKANHIIDASYLYYGKPFALSEQNAALSINLPEAKKAAFMLANIPPSNPISELELSLPKAVDISNMCKGSAIKRIKAFMPLASFLSDSPFASSSIESVDVGEMGRLVNGGRLFMGMSNATSIKGSFPILQQMENMFSGCSKMNLPDLMSMIDFSKITVANLAFNNCRSSSSIELSAPLLNFPRAMFAYLQSTAGTINISLDLPVAIDCCYLVQNTRGVTQVSLNIPRSTHIESLAYNSTNLSTVTGTFTSVTHANNAFYGCKALTAFNGGFPSLRSGNGMFRSCGLNAQSINTIMESLPAHTDGQSHIITFTGCPGAATCNTAIATAKGWAVQR